MISIQSCFHNSYLCSFNNIARELRGENEFSPYFLKCLQCVAIETHDFQPTSQYSGHGISKKFNGEEATHSYLMQHCAAFAFKQSNKTDITKQNLAKACPQALGLGVGGPTATVT